MNKDARDTLIDGLGYVGAAELWDLKRRLTNGGLLRMLDKLPGVKTYFLASLMVLAGLGGCAACVLRWANGSATDPWVDWAAAYAMLHVGLTQITNRLAQDRAAQEQKVVTVAAVAAAQPGSAPQVIRAVEAVSSTPSTSPPGM